MYRKYLMVVELHYKKENVSNNQELVQSEPKSNPKILGDKRTKIQLGTDTNRTYRKMSEYLFP